MAIGERLANTIRKKLEDALRDGYTEEALTRDPVEVLREMHAQSVLPGWKEDHAVSHAFAVGVVNDWRKEHRAKGGINDL